MARQDVGRGRPLHRWALRLPEAAQLADVALREAVADGVVAAVQRFYAAERAELLRLYAARDIDDEVLRRVQQQLDVEEIALQA